MAALLKDLLPASQYIANVKLNPDETRDVVEFAVRLQNDVLCPIDSYWPVEKYKAIDEASQSKNKVDIHKVSKKDDLFNQTLILYSKNYKLLIEELMNNSQYGDILEKFGGRNVTYQGNNYYVNNFYNYPKEYFNLLFYKCFLFF